MEKDLLARVSARVSATIATDHLVRMDEDEMIAVDVPRIVGAVLAALGDEHPIRTTT